MSGMFDVAVVGGGPAGLVAAIAIADAGLKTALIAKPSAGDNRTTALLMNSVTALRSLRVWERCEADAAPLRLMRIVDDTGRLWRAPEVTFDAGEIGLDAFGYNLANRHLTAALAARAAELQTLSRIDGEMTALTLDGAGAKIAMAEGRTISATLVIGADGRLSACRSAAGINSTTRRYDQTALTFTLGHSRPHRGISTEFHTPAGPFTLVPLPGDRSSLVFVTTAAEADTLGNTPEDELARELEARSHSILGKIRIEPGRGQFPLTVAVASRFGQNRVALVGEAAHVLPPIGAQGLNLGLRDAATIAELVTAAHRDGGDIGGADVLTRYDTARRADVTSRTFAVDLVNRTLLTDFLPVQGMRGLGLFAIDRIGPLRRAVMREGVAPALAQPRLMRGEALSSSET